MAGDLHRERGGAARSQCPSDGETLGLHHWIPPSPLHPSASQVQGILQAQGQHLALGLPSAGKISTNISKLSGLMPSNRDS